MTGELTFDRLIARARRRFRSLYLAYPQIRESLTPELRRRLLAPFRVALSSEQEIQGILVKVLLA